MRRLVVCLDGTWANPENLKETSEGYEVFKPSNVLKLFRAVKARDDDGVDQISFYDEGVGGVTGGIWGAGFEKNVTDAYRFLVANYIPGDELFVFGFSRGAAEARSLCRFIAWVGGILEKSDAYFIPECFDGYRASQAKAGAAAKLFAEIRSRERTTIGEPRGADVRFLGVFDTVLALGSRLKVILFRPNQTTVKYLAFHVGTSPPAIVRCARQALAIDEKRKVFAPEIWQRPASELQSLQQRWFPGVHTNVGGGYGDDGVANVALHWMAGEAAACGLDLDQGFLAKYRPWFGDVRHESLKHFYKIRGPRLRDLDAAPDGNVDLDPSVLELLKRVDPDNPDDLYRPTNLFDYLARRRELWAGLPDDILRELEARA